MKAQSVTPSLIIITHHTARSVDVCVCECVYRPLDHCSFQGNRLSLDLSLSSLLWPLCDVRVQVCDHSSSRRNQSFSGNTLLHGINHQPLRILTCSQAHFLVQKQQIFIGRDADQIRGWDMAPFGVEWRPKLNRNTVIPPLGISQMRAADVVHS